MLRIYPVVFYIIFLFGCVTQDVQVLVSDVNPAVTSTNFFKTICVEPFVDGRGLYCMGRMRNAYFWQMAQFLPPDEDSISEYVTRQVKDILKRSGFQVIEEPNIPIDLTVRGRVLCAYSDVSLTLQTKTRIQVDLWQQRHLIKSRTYQGFSHPLAIIPAAQVDNAFRKSFTRLFDQMGMELPYMINEILE